MTDRLIVRDPSQPCEHSGMAYQTGPSDDPHWDCTFYGCPGGEERTFKVMPLTGRTLMDLWKETRVETLGTHDAYPGREVTFVTSPEDKWVLVEITA